MEKQYESYNTEAFLEDDKFISWIRYNRPEDDDFWKTWLLSHPINYRAFKAAETRLRIIYSAERINALPVDVEEVWIRITSSIEDEEEIKKPRVIRFTNWMIAAAIVFAIVIISGIWYNLNHISTKELTAGNGEQKSVILPDASIIKLNANSKLEYLSRWKNGQPREVYLKGEAFFMVDHMNMDAGQVKENEKFIVRTDHVVVEVLGTSFNVKERRDKTEVSLEKGSLKVATRSGNESLQLAPGELAEYNHETRLLKKMSKDPVFHKDWTEKKILANNTTVGEVIEELEDVYGYEVILDDPSLASRRIDGVIPMKSDTNVLFVLSNLLNVDIEKSKKQLYFKSRK